MANFLYTIAPHNQLGNGFTYSSHEITWNIEKRDLFQVIIAFLRITSTYLTKYVSTKHSNISENREHLPETGFSPLAPRRPSFPSLTFSKFTLFYTSQMLLQYFSRNYSLSLGFKTEGNYRYTSDVAPVALPGGKI